MMIEERITFGGKRERRDKGEERRGEGEEERQGRSETEA
jgi:hypothetical protein